MWHFEMYFMTWFLCAGTLWTDEQVCTKSEPAEISADFKQNAKDYHLQSSTHPCLLNISLQIQSMQYADSVWTNWWSKKIYQLLHYFVTYRYWKMGHSCYALVGFLFFNMPVLWFQFFHKGLYQTVRKTVCSAQSFISLSLPSDKKINKSHSSLKYWELACIRVTLAGYFGIFNLLLKCSYLLIVSNMIESESVGKPTTNNNKSQNSLNQLLTLIGACCVVFLTKYNVASWSMASLRDILSTLFLT